jgi:hypothetical protein
MKQIKYSFCFIALLLSGYLASSQKGTTKLDASYKVAVPMGNLRNLISETSGRGWEAAILFGITDAASVGLQAGFQDFYQKYDRQVIHGQGSAISAVITNSVQVIPLMVKGRYLLAQNSTVQPYAALAVGGALVQYRKYYGQFADSRSKVGLAYNYIPYKAMDADGLHHASLKAGVSIPLR